MSMLKAALERALSKANSCSESKLLARFIEDMLDDNGDDPALVAASMAMIIEWAEEFRRAAELSGFDKA